MTPERWRQVTSVFHAARVCEPDARGPLLDRLCGKDESLRAEVEALLGADSSGDADQSLAVDVLPQLSPGTKFGPYRIEALIGAGGMGQVYRATDTRLQRAVAIKVLMPDLALDPAFATRFEREARMLASLNHPNIAAIHGLEQADGVQALVLEFVEGPTLAEVTAGIPHPALDVRQGLRRAPDGHGLSVDAALALARQIAAALEAAHERGIVHRDLKPANIKITPAGVVKVLDFGIARIDSSEARAGLPTRTRTGHVMGTPAYMSPEQARGLPVDKRADIWAFGCVLFEMLTGRGAFAAETASDSLAKVIEREPEWSAVPPDVPDRIRRLLRRCLRKDPADRLRDIGDARIEIDDTVATPPATVEPTRRSTGRTRAIQTALTIAALALVASLIWWRPFGQPSSTAAPVQALEAGVTFQNNAMPADGVAVSPDGRRIAANVWTTSGNIWMYSFDGSQPRALKGGEGGSHPFWSPDSSTIGFYLGGQPSRPGRIVTMSAAGGPVAPVATFEPRGAPYGASWNKDNVILFSGGGKLYQVPASGGIAPVEVPLTGARGVPGAPQFLPDGRHFVFCEARHVGGSMALASLDDGRVIELGESECPGGFAPPDYVLFLRLGSLLAQKIDLGRLALEGQPQVIVSGVTRGSAGPWPELTPSASETGVLALPAPRGGNALGKLTWFDRDGKALGDIDPPSEDVEYLNPAISPKNNQLVAANRLDPQTGAWHVWLIDGARGNAASQLTLEAAADRDPVWSPDGKEIVYASDRGGDTAFYRQAIDGGRAERLPLEVGRLFFPIPSDWSSDGHLLFQQLQQSIWSVPIGDGTATQLGDRQTAAYSPHLSPDGKWLAYAAAPDGRSFEVFVERFPGGSPRKQITTNGGTHPRWTTTAKGTEIAYWSLTAGIESTEISLSDQGIQVGATRVLVPQVLSLIDARTAYDITRDGQRILVREAAGPPSPAIRVIVNWMGKLR